MHGETVTRASWHFRLELVSSLRHGPSSLSQKNSALLTHSEFKGEPHGFRWI